MGPKTAIKWATAILDAHFGELGKAAAEFAFVRFPFHSVPLESLLRIGKAAAVALLLVSCGGQSLTHEAPADAFVDAVCSHTACPGWPEPQVCRYSYSAAMASLGAQDEGCIASATAVVQEPGCGPEIQTVADDVVEGKCSR